MDDNKTTAPDNERIAGILYGIAAYALWGVLPLYWKAVKEVPPWEILAHRIFWSFIFVTIILKFSQRIHQAWELLRQPAKRNKIFLAAILVSINWFVYIFAVNTNQIVQSSLGYYIVPLVSVFLGMVILKERLNFWQLISFLMAVVGVAIITVSYGRLPWISLTLALSFGTYGLVKKVIHVDSLTGLTLETFFVSPIALLYLLYNQVNGTGAFMNAGLFVTVLLILGGAVTAMPLLWFAQAANRIPLSTIGFLQYLAPSISLIIGVFLFKEPFTQVHVVSFSFIWSGLLLFAFSHSKFMIDHQPKVNWYRQFLAISKERKE